MIEVQSVREKVVRLSEGLGLRTDKYIEKVERTLDKKGLKMEDAAAVDLMIKSALENMAEDEPNWTFLASRIYLDDLYKRVSVKRGYDSRDKYGDFYNLVTTLVDKGLYTKELTEAYSKEDIEQLGKAIVPSRDYLLTYVGAHTLGNRYLATDFDKSAYELPQERWMVIAMTLMQKETENRLEKVKESYWAMSNLYMTVATPTLANAGKPHGQLSSCYVDTVTDSLQGIYDSNTDVANLSKYGGGIGVYMGKVRARGSSIRGFKNVSSGVLPWVKQLNNTAVSVDQLGQRQGAIAVYLDVWHKDILTFLDLKLNNGDERMRAHDIFTGICVPDIFMEQVEARGEWHLFDPHEVREVMGYSIEDFYDEKKGKGSFRTKYEECVANPKLSRETIPAIDIMKRILRSQLETGTPYMFYRDEVNRKNANSHAGMIYSSNLCSEIAQNMSPTEEIEKYIEDEDIIVTKRKAGDLVVCNLSSVNLGKAVPDGVLERLIPIQVRMLDNTIDINKLPLEQTKITNQRYRGVGLGTTGWHHLLALEGIEWESEESLEFADAVYEKIAYLTISASADLAEERGSYPLYEGSKWQTGEYFEDKGYQGYHWDALKERVKTTGIRNGYLMAVAPNSSTSDIAGTTASIDPIFKPFYHVEKKDFKLPVIAPDLDHRTYNVYRKSAYIVDQRWSLKQNAVRQKHIDQSLSFNLYVPNNIKATVLLDLHLQAWKTGVKTTYYTRSSATDIEECEWCHS